MHIIQANHNDVPELQNLASKLWPDEPVEELPMALRKSINSPKEALFLVRDTHQRAIAFIQLSLRYDYVPGATRQPVGFVEGLYIEAAHRGAGLGRQLIAHAEKWAFDKGCVELASDALIDNTDSHHFHSRVGFREVERIVTFIKPLQRS
ncbi:MAG: GNAT family N-acetyltransferase [Chloroflexi bacterium AL-W]|nr:GNAT family N-acetyltransferase [Chloroflexi bacterium AL-N1]NOK65277.1 GNAT family N-acetyltransferase [Chloroflexi bacterium AL-N10]NOK72458.1 GNAT family N-acetyltransferase [Chloroflexi bacterium AL-N5]NOK79456.1 GNAT family N-acetyltransferase [Chloroflexi bacterium AL-W]NOK87372.1 GNAT family N-acetyltransferase [Chloroflexi bacterium AL-N15]